MARLWTEQAGKLNQEIRARFLGVGCCHHQDQRPIDLSRSRSNKEALGPSRVFWREHIQKGAVRTTNHGTKVPTLRSLKEIGHAPLDNARLRRSAAVP